MPIRLQDQLWLLKDILNNHQSDCCGSISECEQVERLVKSLMTQNDLKQDLKPILLEVYQYSQSGIQSNHLNQHIESSREELSQWVNGMNQLT
ncbi:YtzH-like family protein [Cytobacillus purgationiresistens]|uniref:Archaellum component FlaC n=1 Tax=Cytobacillus purgationiresistens TaxID=863449 RepID=A0ABU0AN94_9BACI|nr:YtzH-like family protein [Cytobacillus purgationiresistens]MDQ0272226.1 archaellum component FlaC [Cytobacillus purgationiresistens]